MKRLKGLVFSLPAMGLNETIALFSNSLTEDYDIIFYNNNSFSNNAVQGYRFKSYPNYEDGYKPNCVQSDSSYFQFANILVDTTINLMEFLKTEVEIEKPDFIIHSHLALWGKLLSMHFKIPAICLYTTFVFDKKILLPCYHKMYGEKVGKTDISEQLSFTKKTKLLASGFNLNQKLDIWDILVNQQNLNLVFLHKELQPSREILSRKYKFVGYPLNKIRTTETRDLIYVACGSVFKVNTSFYDVCINYFVNNNIRSIIALGNNANSGFFQVLPPYIQILAVADQKKILRDAKIFISHGGMASIHEAIQTLTPIIIVPLIPEHQLTGEKLQELGIGKLIPYSKFSAETLGNAIEGINSRYLLYKNNMRRIQGSLSSSKTLRTAKILLDKYVQVHLSH